MSDQLESFVKQNREGFDSFEPNPELWSKIEGEIEGKNRFLSLKLTKILYRAAMVVVIFTSSVMLLEYIHQSGVNKIGAAGKDQFDIPELREAEMYYGTKLDEKLEEAKPILMKHPELGNELNKDLNELDSIYISIKNDLKDNIANEEVIEALIQNYRMRIEILEDLLEEFDNHNAKGTEDLKNNKYEI